MADRNELLDELIRISDDIREYACKLDREPSPDLDRIATKLYDISNELIDQVRRIRTNEESEGRPVQERVTA